MKISPTDFDPTAALVALEPDICGIAGQPLALRYRLQRWWRDQITPRVEDQSLDSGGRPLTRLVAPALAPVLLVPALLLLREPGNQLATYSLVVGAAAIVYALAAESFARRRGVGFWLHLTTAAVYVALISALLLMALVMDHPRPHIHWILFFLYFLLIGATAMSDDPRQPLCAGGLSVIGYAVVVPLLHRAALSGVPMAQQLLPEFEWVANSTKIALLAGTTLVATSSAKRGRAVRRMSLRDGLTGLLNRHAFDDCLSQLARRSKRQGHALTVAMIDIDHFKSFNDTYGHIAGDAVLRWVAARIQQTFRVTDVVARYGGEEFVVAFPDTSDARILERLEVLRQTIGSMSMRNRQAGTDGDVATEGDTIRVTVSIGTARVPCDTLDVTGALELADQNLYEAKSQGRNCIVSH